MSGVNGVESRLLGTLLLLSMPSIAQAGSVHWRSDAQVSRGALGSINHEELSYRVRSQRGADGFSDTEIVLVRAGNDGAAVEQVLFEGVGSAAADKYDLHLGANQVDVIFPSGEPRAPEQLFTTWRYVWNGADNRFDLETSYTNDLLWEQIQTIAAHLAVTTPDARTGTSFDLTGGIEKLATFKDAHPHYFMTRRREIFLECLRGMHRTATELFRADRRDDAARLLAAFFEQMSSITGERGAHPERVSVCARELAPCEGVNPLANFVLPDALTAVMLNDMGYFLDQGGVSSLAVHLLLQVATFFPDRAVAHLNLADAAWNAGVKGLATDHYTRFLELRVDGPADRIPARVKDRLGPVAATVVSRRNAPVRTGRNTITAPVRSTVRAAR